MFSSLDHLQKCCLDLATPLHLFYLRLKLCLLIMQEVLTGKLNHECYGIPLSIFFMLGHSRFQYGCCKVMFMQSESRLVTRLVRFKVLVAKERCLCRCFPVDSLQFLQPMSILHAGHCHEDIHASYIPHHLQNYSQGNTAYWYDSNLIVRQVQVI